GIRDFHVTGVQTCALPISAGAHCRNACQVARKFSPAPKPVSTMVKSFCVRKRPGSPLPPRKTCRACSSAPCAEAYTSSNREEYKIGRASCRERVEIHERD